MNGELHAVGRTFPWMCVLLLGLVLTAAWGCEDTAPAPPDTPSKAPQAAAPPTRVAPPRPPATLPHPPSEPSAPVIDDPPQVDFSAVVLASSPCNMNETLRRELWRQALLIAAREEMSLPIYDEVLCGPVDTALNTRFDQVMTKRDEPDLPATKRFGPLTLEVNASSRQTPGELKIGRLKPSYEDANLRKLVPVFQTDFSGSGAIRGDNRPLLPMIAHNEAASRSWLVKLLKELGYTATPVAQTTPTGAPMTSADPRLGGLDLWNHMASIHEAHRSLRAHGDSAEALATLARGYAQLGVLTDFFWNAGPEVFAARGLLYAERLARKHPDSASAAWCRAYVLALAGLHKDALAEHERASGLPAREAPPPWTFLIRPYCRGDAPALQRASTESPQLAPWALLLRFALVQRETNGVELFAAGDDVLRVEPRCFRVLDALAGWSYANPAYDYRQRFLQSLRPSLASLSPMSDLPPAVASAIGQTAAPGAELKDLEAVAQALVDAGDLARGSTDTYWAELGWLVRETAFAAAFHEAHYLHETTTLDRKAVQTSGKPLRELVIEHAYWNVIAIHLQRREPLAHSEVLSRIPYRDLTPAFFHMSGGDIDTVPEELRFWPRAGTTAFGRPSPERPDEFLPRARQPLEPAPPTERGVFFDPRRDRDPLYTPPAHLAKSIKAWRDVGGRYAAVGHYDKARQAYGRAIEIAPDALTYQRIADTYWLEQDAAGYIAAMTALAKEATCFGPERALANERLALFLLSRGEAERALPLAETAATDGPQHTREVLALCHEALGQWEQATKLVREPALDRGGVYAVKYYLWCQRTGRGDAGEALQLAQAEIERLRARYHHEWRHLSDEHRQRWEVMKRPDEIELEAVVAQLEDRTKEADGMFLALAREAKSPWSVLHAALRADAAGDSQRRDELLNALNPDVLTPYGESTSPWIGAMLWLVRDHLKQPQGPFDRVSLEVLWREAPLPERVELACAAATYLRARGETEQARQWLERANGPLPVARFAQTLAAVELRRISPELATATSPAPAGGADKFTIEAVVAKASDLHLTPWGLYWSQSVNGLNDPPEPDAATIDGNAWKPRWGRPRMIASSSASSGWPLALAPLRWRISEIALSPAGGGDADAELGEASAQNWRGETIITLRTRAPAPVRFRLTLTRDASLPDAAETAPIRPLTPADVLPRSLAEHQSRMARVRAKLPKNLTQDPQGDDRLHQLVKRDNIDQITEYLSEKRTLGGLGPSGETALHWARSPEVAELLLDAGAGLETRSTQKQQTPLHWAAFFGHSSAVASLLLQRGADPNAVDHQGKTPLHLTAASKGPEAAAIVAALLEAGADPNAIDQAGESPLAGAKDDAVAKLLRDAGTKE